MSDQDPTSVLHASSAGDAAATAALAPLVYNELRRLAAGYLAEERANHTLQPTALVNEALLRLFDQTRVRWNDRSHFIAVAAMAMRRILVDHARARMRLKRGSGAVRTATAGSGDADVPGSRSTLELDDVLDLETALQELETFDPDRARLVELRAFAGLSIVEAAEVTGRSTASVTRDWALARAWLRRRLDPA